MIIFKTIKIDDELSPHSKTWNPADMWDIFWGNIPTNLNHEESIHCIFTLYQHGMACMKGNSDPWKIQGWVFTSFFCGLPPAWKIGKGHRASLCMFKEKCEKPGCWTGFLSSKTENRTTLENFSIYAGWIWSLTLTPPLAYLIEPPCGGIAIRLKLGVHEVIYL